MLFDPKPIWLTSTHFHICEQYALTYFTEEDFLSVFIQPLVLYVSCVTKTHSGNWTLCLSGYCRVSNCAVTKPVAVKWQLCQHHPFWACRGELTHFVVQFSSVISSLTFTSFAKRSSDDLKREGSCLLCFSLSLLALLHSQCQKETALLLTRFMDSTF